MGRDVQAPASIATAATFDVTAFESTTLDRTRAGFTACAVPTHIWHKADTDTTRFCPYRSGRGAPRPHGGGWTSDGGGWTSSAERRSTCVGGAANGVAAPSTDGGARRVTAAIAAGLDLRRANEPAVTIR